MNVGKQNRGSKKRGDGERRRSNKNMISKHETIKDGKDAVVNEMANKQGKDPENKSNTSGYRSLVIRLNVPED